LETMGLLVTHSNLLVDSNACQLTAMSLMFAD
jgi:hypothetical protein